MTDTTDALTEEEKASIPKYAAVVPNYPSGMWWSLCLILELRVTNDVDAMSEALRRAENVYVLLTKELRSRVEDPFQVVFARIRDVSGPEWGYKALLGFTKWQLEHATLSQRQREMYEEKRLAKIYSSFLLEFCKNVTDVFSEAGILIAQDNRFNPVTDEGAGGRPETWQPTEQ